MNTLNTLDGGVIKTYGGRSKFHGIVLVLVVDQSNNLVSGDDSCTISLTSDECKSLINLLSQHIDLMDGKPYVILKDSIDNFTESDDYKEYLKWKENKSK
jgi:hypothetical protein